jgi:hypothetical protein
MGRLRCYGSSSRTICILALAALTYAGSFGLARHDRTKILQGRRRELKERDIGLIEGFLLCLLDSQAVRLQTSRWKRSLLVFSSGVCLEIAALPLLVGLIGYETSWYGWLLTWLFAPLGLVGLYASKFGDDRLVESLLVIPKLDLRL